MKQDCNPESVLLVTRNFPPRWGGMEKLNWHIADELGKRCSVCVVAPVGAANSGLPNAIEVTEVRLSPLLVFLLEATWKTIRIAWRQKPDIVLAGSGLTAPIAWLAARLFGSRSMAYVHGLDITVPHFIYRNVWLPFVRRMDKVFANSRATATLATNAGIPSDRIEIIHPGVSLPQLDPMARTRFRAAHALGERPILLSVGRLTQRKGILEFVGECMPTIVATHPDCLLLIAGESPKYALHSVNLTYENIYDAAKKLVVSDNIKIIKAPSDDELSQIFQAADVHIFPVVSIPNNPEGFGMVAVEAAAHGLPTVAFEVGGIRDSIDHQTSGCLIPSGDYEAMNATILQYLNKMPLTAISCRQFARGFQWTIFGSKLYSSICGIQG
jgi:phosphatidylinositol alpha-1,6-mannosyltransferase